MCRYQKHRKFVCTQISKQYDVVNYNCVFDARAWLNHLWRMGHILGRTDIRNDAKSNFVEFTRIQMFFLSVQFWNVWREKCTRTNIIKKYSDLWPVLDKIRVYTKYYVCIPMPNSYPLSVRRYGLKIAFRMFLPETNFRLTDRGM